MPYIVPVCFILPFDRRQITHNTKAILSSVRYKGPMKILNFSLNILFALYRFSFTPRGKSRWIVSTSYKRVIAYQKSLERVAGIWEIISLFRISHLIL